MDMNQEKDLDRLTNEVIDAIIGDDECDLEETDEDKERCKMGKLPLEPDGYKVRHKEPQVYDEFTDPYGGY